LAPSAITQLLNRQAGGLEVLLAALQLEDVRCRTWSACAGLRICCGEDSAAKKQRQHAMEVRKYWGISGKNGDRKDI